MSRQRRTRDPLQSSSHWWHHLKLSTQKFSVVLSVLAVSLGFTYVWLTNQTAASGFAIDELQAQVAELQTSNERLELEAADLRALSAVELTSQTLQLEPVNDFDVLVSGTGAVAVQQ